MKKHVLDYFQFWFKKNVFGAVFFRSKNENSPKPCFLNSSHLNTSSINVFFQFKSEIQLQKRLFWIEWTYLGCFELLFQFKQNSKNTLLSCFFNLRKKKKHVFGAVFHIWILKNTFLDCFSIWIQKSHFGDVFQIWRIEKTLFWAFFPFLLLKKTAPKTTFLN